MTRFYRLRNGKLTWTSGNDRNVIRHLQGTMGLPVLEPDAGSWRLLVPLACDCFDAKISISLHEPEFPSLAFALMQVDIGDLVTISGSGRLAIRSQQPSQAVEPQVLSVVDQLEMADTVIHEFGRKLRCRAGIAA